MRTAYGLAAAAFAMFGITQAPAATLTHAYDFNGSSIVDKVGSVNGTLFGDASVSGGYLNLDGAGDYAELAGKIVPTSGAFSVYLRYNTTVFPSDPSGFVELISQGATQGPGFYIGATNGRVRLTDYFSDGIASAFPIGMHDFLFTTGGSDGTQFLVDGVVVFTSGQNLTFGSGGSNTRFGRQFQPFNEYFNGQLDEVRVFDGIATYAEASSVAAVPEPAAWALMVGGIGAIGGALRRRSKANMRVRYA